MAHDPRGNFQLGDVVVLIDAKGRKHLVRLTEEARYQVVSGYIDANDLIGQPPGIELATSKGTKIDAYRATLEEYVLLMRRAAQIIPPKDIAYIVHWADIFPGATVIEAGFGSAALSMGLLRAVGPQGKVIAMEQREDHARRGEKNVEQWPENLGQSLEVLLGDAQELIPAQQGVDRVVLDMPEPWICLEAVIQALAPGGIWVVYVPGIRQIDTFVQAVIRSGYFAPPEVAEVIMRPWVADKVRLRPELRITGHTGFIARARRRARPIKSEE